MTRSIKNTSILMLGTFGLRPKATLRSRAIAIAETLAPDLTFSLVTTPWDHPSDAGKRWIERGVRVANTRATRPALFPLAVREMIREADRLRPNLIHLFKPKGFGDLAARRLVRRLPVVVDMDDWEGNGGWNEIGGYSSLQRLLFDWQERTWPRRGTAVTVASRELERRALRLGASPASVVYVPNGLTHGHFEKLAKPNDGRVTPNSRSSFAGKQVVVLYTRFVEFDPRDVVQVMSYVRREVPDVMLLVVGASPDREAETTLMSSAREAGIAGAIDLAGWSQPDDIPALLALGKLAIHPFDDNLVNRAKCSVKLLELMAAGLPVVTNHVGENAQTIEHERSGLLVPPGNPRAMASAVVELLRRPERAREIGASAQDRVRTCYLWDRLAPRVVAAYELALKRPARQP